MNKKSFIWSLFAASSALSIFVGFFLFEPAEAGEMFGQTGYWFILATAILFACLVAKNYGSNICSWFLDKKQWPVIAFAFVATIFLYTREGGGFKITFDEHTISNVAKSLHFERLAIYRESSLPGIENTYAIDKRPILFQFLLATVHDIFGYSISNAFYLNGFLTGILLLLLFSCVSKLYDQRAGWFVILLTCCSPLIGQNASGGGLEIINLVGIISCFLLAQKYADNPHLIGRFSCLIVAAALFSHARYESPFLVLPVIATISMHWIRLKFTQISWPAVVVPLIFISIAWQHSYTASFESFNQYKYDTDGLFSLSYMSTNLGHATNFLFTSNKFSSNSPLIAVLGITGLVSIISFNLTRFKAWSAKCKELHTAQIFGVAIVAEFILILGFTYGQLDDPIVTRLGMPFLVLILICAGLSLSMLQSVRSKLKPAIYILIAICFIYALPLYSNHLYTKNNKVLESMEWIMAHHKKLPKGNYLYISKYPQEMSLNQIGSISLRRSLTKIEQLKLHKDIKTYDDIFVVQSLKFIMKDGTIQTTLLSGNDIGPWFELDTIDEISLTPYNLIRLSRISNISLLSEDDNSEMDLRESLLSAKPKRIYEIKPKAYDAWFKTLP
ncbi:MAG: hypothetical protein HN457_17605 [Opitutales bacterium]|nr:hypothetical protein [Opitutales bacterium]